VLYLVVLGALVTGAGAALLYVFAHPIEIQIEGKTACMFTLPPAFGVPERT
jgi:hypothetical protein